jgi:tight adherence protein B
MSLLTIFVILLVAAFATAAYFSEPSEAEKRFRERLSALARGGGGDDLDELIVREVTFSRIALVDRFLRRNQMALELHLMLEQAKLDWTVGRFFFYSAGLVVVGGLLGQWWLPVGWIGWIPGVLFGMGPAGWIGYQRAIRLRAMNKQLPEAVELMGRALRAGYSLPSALVMVAEEAPDPLGPEFRRTADELNYGLPFRDALLNLQQRCPLEDLRFVITAILVQKETGGDLVELLDKIAGLLRARIQLREKVRVYTAQGRITGVILVSMPFICFVLLNLVKPGYTRPLFESEAGRRFVYGALAGIALGIGFIRRIIDVRV